MMNRRNMKKSLRGLQIAFLVAGFAILTACSPKNTMPDGNGMMFSKFYGGVFFDWAEDVLSTTDGGFIIAGSSESFTNGGSDVLLIKTDAEGNDEWIRNFGDLGNETGAAVVALSDGYVVAGHVESLEDRKDIFVVRTNLDGDTVWTRTYGNAADDEEASKIIQTKDGGFAVLGVTAPAGNTDTDFLLLKIAADGTQEWMNSFGFFDAELAASFYQDENEDYFLFGTTRKQIQNDFILISVDDEGNELWFLTYGVLDEEVGTDMVVTGDGFLLAGTRIPAAGGQPRAVIKKVSAGGVEEWEYEAEDGTTGEAVIETVTGKVVLTGTITETGSQTSDLLIKVTDGAGNEINKDEKQFGSNNSIEQASEITIVNGDEVIVAGTTEFENNQMAWLLKVLIEDLDE